MKALTVMQPWASLIACGAKRCETRSWATRHRGLLAIHASAGLPPRARDLLADSRFSLALGIRGPAGDFAGLPRGAVVAVAVLADCVPTQEVAGDLDPREVAFGDYSSGRWAWVLGDVRPLPQPVPARGRLGLWEWGGRVEP